MKVICIDDSNRPNEVPANRWVKEGENYTITETCKMNTQGGIMGVKLEEIDNDDLGIYKYFRASRFAPTSNKTELELELEEYEIRSV